MKNLTLLILISFCQPVYSDEDLGKVARCDWGYKNTSLIINKNSKDAFYPTQISSWELCKLAFEPDPAKEGSSWVTESISFLKIPPKQIRPLEMLTKKGQCEIGSILNQKKNLTTHDNVAIKLIAENICKSMSASLLSNKMK